VSSLVSLRGAQALDAQAHREWALHPFALVEAAGRACAEVLVQNYPEYFRPRAAVIRVLAGPGNNGADAMVLLRTLLVKGLASVSSCALFVSRFPPDNEANPSALAFRSLRKMNVPVRSWEEIKGEGKAAGLLAGSDIILDGLTGTGLTGPLRGAALEIADMVNGLTGRRLVISVDVPSGLGDAWEKGMPIVKSGATLAIEPRKICLYKPSARTFAGKILSVGGIFPRPLIEEFEEARLITWPRIARSIPPVKNDAFKHQRGLVEIRAGAPGTAGAARIAARGAQAVGAGLIKLIVDKALYPILAAGSGGIMVDDGSARTPFGADSVLLGPGWGKGEGRAAVFEKSLEAEAEGKPLILDADAIALAGNRTFHGNAILTPHPGEFSAWTGIPREDVFSDPVSVLKKTAAEKKAVILYKGHVMYIVSFDGRVGIVDGMAAVLAAGGSGDLLAGFCAGLAARMRKSAGERARSPGEDTGNAAETFDAFTCAAAAARLRVETGKKAQAEACFVDPLRLAAAAASLAGRAWLPGQGQGGS
jgi:NAD(P)H-hydrate epimerase